MAKYYYYYYYYSCFVLCQQSLERHAIKLSTHGAEILMFHGNVIQQMPRATHDHHAPGDRKVGELNSLVDPHFPAHRSTVPILVV